MNILKKYMVKQFEDRMIAHLRLNFPEQTKDREESSLRTMIQGGIEKASKFGVKFESDVQTFLEYVTIYGHDFEMNPELSWAANILYDKSLNLAYTHFEFAAYGDALMAIARGLAADQEGVYRERLLEKQHQILSAASARQGHKDGEAELTSPGSGPAAPPGNGRGRRSRCTPGFVEAAVAEAA